MNSLSQYILEKLKINKNSKITGKNPLEQILYVSGLDAGNYDFKDSEKFANIINSWIDKYNVKEVDCIITEETDKEYTQYFNDFDEEFCRITVDNELYNHYNKQKKESLLKDDWNDIYINEIILPTEHGLEIGCIKQNDYKMIFLQMD